MVISKVTQTKVIDVSLSSHNTEIIISSHRPVSLLLGFLSAMVQDVCGMQLFYLVNYPHAWKEWGEWGECKCEANWEVRVRERECKPGHEAECEEQKGGYMAMKYCGKECTKEMKIAARVAHGMSPEIPKYDPETGQYYTVSW